MLDNKRGVSIKEVEDAVQRAMESAEWAKQMDDARALRCLKSFLTSQNAKSLLYVHLVALQPEISGHPDKDHELKHLSHDRVCEMYEAAVRGANTSDIIDVKYVGLTNLGSAMYELISCINPTVTVYVRMCRTGLRAELKEDDFLVMRREPAEQPKGFMSFIKKIWNSQ